MYRRKQGYEEKNVGSIAYRCDDGIFGIRLRQERTGNCGTGSIPCGGRINGTGSIRGRRDNSRGNGSDNIPAC